MADNTRESQHFLGERQNRQWDHFEHRRCGHRTGSCCSRWFTCGAHYLVLVSLIAIILAAVLVDKPRHYSWLVKPDEMKAITIEPRSPWIQSWQLVKQIGIETKILNQAPILVSPQRPLRRETKVLKEWLRCQTYQQDKVLSFYSLFSGSSFKLRLDFDSESTSPLAPAGQLSVFRVVRRSHLDNWYPADEHLLARLNSSFRSVRLNYKVEETGPVNVFFIFSYWLSSGVSKSDSSFDQMTLHISSSVITYDWDALSTIVDCSPMEKECRIDRYLNMSTIMVRNRLKDHLSVEFALVENMTTWIYVAIFLPLSILFCLALYWCCFRRPANRRLNGPLMIVEEASIEEDSCDERTPLFHHGANVNSLGYAIPPYTPSRTSSSLPPPPPYSVDSTHPSV